jgi:hypothetical protein
MYYLVLLGPSVFQVHITHPGRGWICKMSYNTRDAGKRDLGVAKCSLHGGAVKPAISAERITGADGPTTSSKTTCGAGTLCG